MTNALTPYQQLNALLEKAGVSKTVYTYVMPETEAAFDRLLDEDRESIRDMYRESWTQKQDTMHEEFFDTWRAWVAPIVRLTADYSYVYTTCGASEALREAVHDYGARARAEGFTPVIHVFEAEYEGFTAYAQAAGIRVVAHPRASWREAVGAIGPRDQFYLSQPSAIDGNVWGDYPDFARALYAAQPTAELMLDLTYVGCVAKEFSVDASFPNIRAVFFSLSKPLGAYYHRIGGMLSRAAYPGLFGNKWFKNLLSLRLGTLMMQSHGVYDLPRKYSLIGQRPALYLAQQKLGLTLEASDAFILATAAPSPEMSGLERYLQRNPGGRLRICLTPTIAHLINPVLSSVVKARPHEGIITSGRAA